MGVAMPRPRVLRRRAVWGSGGPAVTVELFPARTPRTGRYTPAPWGAVE